MISSHSYCYRYSNTATMAREAKRSLYACISRPLKNKTRFLRNMYIVSQPHTYGYLNARGSTLCGFIPAQSIAI